MADDATDLGWRILFNEPAPQNLDPNIPANIPRKMAEDRARHEGIQRFLTGEGKDLAGQWSVGIKSGLLTLLQSADSGCPCPACITLRKVKVLYNLFMEAGHFLKGKA